MESLMPRSSFQAVVFDLDGTLVDSRVAVIEAVAAGIREVAAEAGLPEPDIDPDRLRAPLGRPAPEYFRAVLGETLGHLAAPVKEAATRHEVEAFEQGRGRLHPGVLDALDSLRSTGMKLAAVSNAQAPYFRAALECTGLADRLDHSECYEDLPEGSPAPFKLTLLRRALVALEVEARSTVMAGDRRDDIEAGSAAGCTTLAIPFGFGTAEELEGADLRIDSFAELRSALGLRA
jgi:phosphoglycolate phosphatase